MKTLFFLLLNLGSYSQAMVIQSGESDILEFSQYALQRNQQTYTQWYRDQAQVNSEKEPHPQVIDFSQRILSGPKIISKQAREDWQTLRKVIDLNQGDREVLTSLAEKMGINMEYCRYLLLSEQKKLKDCAHVAIPVPEAVFKQLQPTDLLVIDGQIFNFEQIPRHLVAGSYQWKIISDKYIDINFTGSASDFAKQTFHHESWVTGNCNSYKLNHSDFTVLSQSQIFFDKNCIQSGLAPEKTVRSWMKEHKKLTLALGLIIGGFAAYQLKDKTLILTPY